MFEDDAPIEVFVQPGEVFIGDGALLVRTLLGSCVTFTVWHRRTKVGGMCHYMMPRRPAGPSDEPLDGRYGDEAMKLLDAELAARGLRLSGCEVKVFGGGSQFEGKLDASTFDVHARNVETALALLHQWGLEPAAMHLGGVGHRLVVLDLRSGEVWMRHVDKSRPAARAGAGSRSRLQSAAGQDDV